MLVGDAIRRPRGVVPDLLSEFSEARYVERVHAIIDTIASGALARA
jgi:hypothetical protein